MQWYGLITPAQTCDAGVSLVFPVAGLTVTLT
jgi:hypothetical protein